MTPQRPKPLDEVDVAEHVVKPSEFLERRRTNRRDSVAEASTLAGDIVAEDEDGLPSVDQDDPRYWTPATC